MSLSSSGIPIDGVSGVYGEPDFNIWFKDSATQEQIELANEAAVSFIWEDRLINFDYFKYYISNDSEISMEAKVELIKYFPLLEDYLTRDATVKSTWLRIKSVYGLSWLTPSIQSIIEEYAVQFNIPLV